MSQVKYVNKNAFAIVLPTPTGGQRSFRPNEGTFNQYYKRFCKLEMGLSEITVDESNPVENEVYRKSLEEEKNLKASLAKLYPGTPIADKAKEEVKKIDTVLGNKAPVVPSESIVEKKDEKPPVVNDKKEEKSQVIESKKEETTLKPVDPDLAISLNLYAKPEIKAESPKADAPVSDDKKYAVEKIVKDGKEFFKCILCKDDTMRNPASMTKHFNATHKDHGNWRDQVK